MHLFPSINLLLCCSLTLLSPHTTASCLSRPPNPLLSTPQQTSRNVRARSWFSYARDNLVQTIWRIPPSSESTAAHGKALALARPPPTFLARYGGDLVLRFEINSVDEAEALAQAINVLFLDVWEFTTDWVDIRLSKDVVS